MKANRKQTSKAILGLVLVAITLAACALTAPPTRPEPTPRPTPQSIFATATPTVEPTPAPTANIGMPVDYETSAIIREPTADNPLQFDYEAALENIYIAGRKVGFPETVAGFGAEFSLQGNPIDFQNGTVYDGLVCEGVVVADVLVEGTPETYGADSKVIRLVLASAYVDWIASGNNTGVMDVRVEDIVDSDDILSYFGQPTAEQDFNFYYEKEPGADYMRISIVAALLVQRGCFAQHVQRISFHRDDTPLTFDFDDLLDNIYIGGNRVSFPKCVGDIGDMGDNYSLSSDNLFMLLDGVVTANIQHLDVRMATVMLRGDLSSWNESSEILSLALSSHKRRDGLNGAYDFRVGNKTSISAVIDHFGAPSLIINGNIYYINPTPDIDGFTLYVSNGAYIEENTLYFMEISRGEPEKIFAAENDFSFY